MPFYIQTNIPSVIAQRNLNGTRDDYNQALERLSSGLRINTAADDAAGLAISTRFTAQIRGYDVAIRNAQDAVSLTQTAEAALGSVTDSLLRIRDLALQSANGTYSDDDRKALDAEVQQLVDEVERVSEKTVFNDTTILDGTFEDITFQVGPNESDRITVSLEGATIGTLGTGAEDGLSSDQQGTGDSVATAMEAGDLIINGIAVGSSDGGDDGFSSAGNSSSAIAKAAAVNRVSADSGVTAVVGETRVAGSSSTFNAGATGGTVLINGVSIQLPAGSGQGAVQQQNVVNAINASSGRTGVVAEFSGSTTTGVTLVAEDGRNIVIENGSATASDYGLAGATTYAGSYTLVSNGGNSIDIDTGGNIENTGFAVGTFSGNNSGVVGQSVTAEALQTGDLTINGVAVPASARGSDTSSPGDEGGASAIAKVAAINSVSEQTGVTAQVGQTILAAGTTFTVGQADGSFLLNGVDISVAHSSQDSIPEQVKLTVAAINTKSGQTGVVAESFGNSYRLIAEDGRNIVVENDGPTPLIDLADIGFGAATTGVSGNLEVRQSGSIVLSGAGSIEIGSLTGNIDRAGFAVGTYGSAETGTLIQDISVGTVESALEAIGAVDNALDSINLQRANIGAIQSRFDETIENQRIAQENLLEARARIRDADFAEETANLAKAQVLQQAGISVLAQANAQTQQVLSLLQ